MGRAGRKKMEREYSEEIVIDSYRQVIGELTARHGTAYA
jgi:hypothetical protein